MNIAMKREHEWFINFSQCELEFFAFGPRTTDIGRCVRSFYTPQPSIRSSRSVRTQNYTVTPRRIEILHQEQDIHISTPLTPYPSSEDESTVALRGIHELLHYAVHNSPDALERSLQRRNSVVINYTDSDSEHDTIHDILPARRDPLTMCGVPTMSGHQCIRWATSRNMFTICACRLHTNMMRTNLKRVVTHHYEVLQYGGPLVKALETLWIRNKFTVMKRVWALRVLKTFFSKIIARKRGDVCCICQELLYPRYWMAFKGLYHSTCGRHKMHRGCAYRYHLSGRPDIFNPYTKQFGVYCPECRHPEPYIVTTLGYSSNTFEGSPYVVMSHWLYRIWRNHFKLYADEIANYMSQWISVRNCEQAIHFLLSVQQRNDAEYDYSESSSLTDGSESLYSASIDDSFS